MKRDSLSVKMTAALAAYERRENESRSAAITRCAATHGVSVSGLDRALKAQPPTPTEPSQVSE